MPRDEFRRPLKPRSLWQRLWAKRPSLFTFTAATLLISFVGGGIWLVRIPRPFAGEPVIVMKIPGVTEFVTSSTTPAADAAPPADEEAAAQGPEDVIDESAAEILPVEEAAPREEPAYQQEASIIVAPNRPLKKAPIEAVTEKTGEGPLPRISTRGKTPFEAYSQITPMAVLQSGRPKIALVLGGMGLNQKLTRRAIDQLPGDVTLGFAPYGEDLQSQVNKARARGHEVLLQVPMEPVGYPGTNPGPKTLTIDATAADNLTALKWHMSRFAGYSGIVNYMGARLLVAEDALRPVLKELKGRGLVYLETGTGNPT
uniref:divergent polysaccharide deacetylase family protein n=1 Tax=Aestuariivirga sp. TaxID=2650926 RepID=UPI003784541B